jgi:DNA-binding transcriptional ArsR family regulator
MERRDLEFGTTEARRRVETKLLNGELDLEAEMERFSAIGDETRFLTLFLLSEEGPLTSGELADAIDKRQNHLYYHLTTLKEAGLVGTTEGQRNQSYKLSETGKEVVADVFGSLRRRSGIESGGDAEGTTGEDSASNPDTESVTTDGGTADSSTADGGTADSNTADGGTADSSTADGGTADSSTAGDGTAERETDADGASDTTSDPQWGEWSAPEEPSSRLGDVGPDTRQW